MLRGLTVDKRKVHFKRVYSYLCNLNVDTNYILTLSETNKSKFNIPIKKWFVALSNVKELSRRQKYLILFQVGCWAKIVSDIFVSSIVF